MKTKKMISTMNLSVENRSDFRWQRAGDSTIIGLIAWHAFPPTFSRRIVCRLVHLVLKISPLDLCAIMFRPRLCINMRQSVLAAILFVAAIGFLDPSKLFAADPILAGYATPPGIRSPGVRTGEASEREGQVAGQDQGRARCLADHAGKRVAIENRRSL